MAGRILMRPNTMNEFWLHVRKTGTCWYWTGHRRAAYGRFDLGGKKQQAHRLAWIAVNGPIPDGSDVLHKCDVPSCVRPAHLFLGDQATNNRDMCAKGRHRVPLGIAHWHARLSPAVVRSIRRMSECGVSQRKIARRFGVSFGCIYSVVVRRTWKEVA